MFVRSGTIDSNVAHSTILAGHGTCIEMVRNKAAAAAAAISVANTQIR